MRAAGATRCCSRPYLWQRRQQQSWSRGAVLHVLLSSGPGHTPATGTHECIQGWGGGGTHAVRLPSLVCAARARMSSEVTSEKQERGSEGCGSTDGTAQKSSRVRGVGVVEGAVSGSVSPPASVARAVPGLSFPRRSSRSINCQQKRHACPSTSHLGGVTRCGPSKKAHCMQCVVDMLSATCRRGSTLRGSRTVVWGKGLGPATENRGVFHNNGRRLAFLFDLLLPSPHTPTSPPAHPPSNQPHTQASPSLAGLRLVQPIWGTWQCPLELGHDPPAT